jgi:serine/threonine-protein kinase
MTPHDAPSSDTWRFEPAQAEEMATVVLSPYRAPAEADTPALCHQPTVRNGAARGGPDPLVGDRSALVGQTFGDFELLAEVGRGGVGLVFKAWQRSLDRVVALKVLPLGDWQDELRVPRFLAEARAAARLCHPHIVKVYGTGEYLGQHYYAMEFIDGPTLATAAARRKLSVPETVAVLTAVAEAVHYAHTQGIVHRDLKPANILLDPFGRPILIDFGLAKFLEQPSTLTPRGAVVGTPAYLAPEQVCDDLGPVGPASDVYSLGAVLYTLLTGRTPYEERSYVRALLKVLAAEPPPAVRSLQPEVPAELERICLKCLSKRPADRYATTRALADDLRRFPFSGQ